MKFSKDFPGKRGRVTKTRTFKPKDPREIAFKILDKAEEALSEVDKIKRAYDSMCFEYAYHLLMNRIKYEGMTEADLVNTLALSISKYLSLKSREESLSIDEQVEMRCIEIETKILECTVEELKEFNNGKGNKS